MFAHTHPQKTTCPYCSERIEIIVDGSIEAQVFIEDCQVCCRPIEFHVVIHSDDDIEIHATAENDTY